MKTNDAAAPAAADDPARPDNGALFPDTHFPDLAAYLNDRVEPQPSGCWEWQRSRHRQGYGYLGGKNSLSRRYGTPLAHRLAYLATHGSLPEKPLVLRHTCDNPRCCNPNHLLPGSLADNAMDMKERGRAAKGERNGLAKLDAEKVMAIRRSRLSERRLAKRYKVNPTTIGDARRGDTWRHLPGATKAA